MKKLNLFLALLCGVFAQAQTTPLAVPSPAVNMAQYSCPASPGSNQTAVWNGGVLQICVLEFQWGAIDGTSSSATAFNPAAQSYTTMDSTISTYTNAGHNVAILLSPSADISPNSTSAGTPQYVQVNGEMCFCPGYAGTGWGGGNGCFAGSSLSGNYTGVSDPLNSFFQAAWWGTPTLPGFVPTAIAHMKSQSYWGHVVYIAVGFDRGGENYPSCDPYEKQALANATDQQLQIVWAQGSGALAASLASALNGTQALGFIGIACVNNSSFPSTANKCALADAVAAQVAASSIAYCKGCVGLRLTIYRDSDRYNFFAGAPAESDWINVFSSYGLPMDVQPGQTSSPNFVNANSNGNCTTNTGTWTQMLPFVSQHWGQATYRIFEGLQNDWYGAYSSTYNDVGAACWNTAGNFVTNNGGFPYGPYDTALKFFAQGYPAGASMLGGK